MSDGPPRPTTPLAMQSELLSIGAPPLSVGKIHVATSDEAVEVLTLGAPPPSSALGRTARDVTTTADALDHPPTPPMLYAATRNV
mgnify:CR=1 FL=1